MIPRVHRRGAGRRFTISQSHVRVHGPPAPAGEGGRRGRLHLPQQAAREVLRPRRGSDARRARARSGSKDVRPKAFDRGGAPRSARRRRRRRAAADQPGRARRPVPAAHPRRPRPRRRRPTPARGRPTSKSFKGRRCGAIDEQERDANCATCHLRIDRSASRWKGSRGRPHAQRRNDGKPVDTTASSRKTPIVGADGPSGTCRSRTPGCMTTLSSKIIGYASDGRRMPSDRPLIWRIIQAGGDATFADLGGGGDLWHPPDRRRWRRRPPASSRG